MLINRKQPPRPRADQPSLARSSFSSQLGVGMKIIGLCIVAAVLATVTLSAPTIVGGHHVGLRTPINRQPAWLKDPQLVGLSPAGKPVRIIAFASTTKFAIGDVSYEESPVGVEGAAESQL